MREYYADILPSNSPLPFTSMANVEKQGKRYTADVEMFDGLKAKLQIIDTPIPSFKWLSLDGGDIFLESGVWRRVDYPA